jgi:digeranylgeranylglycerophospholipid reductase
MNQYDVIVVGAGTGGCIAAKTLAQAGFNVCLIDRKDKASIGIKVCGDAVGKHHFSNLGLAVPEGEEKEGDIVGMRIYSPDRETVFRIVGEGLTGFMINRYLFGQRLLKDTLDAGAVLLDSTHVLNPVIEDGYVTGVSAKSLRDHSEMKLRAAVTVDASGVSSVVRTKLPAEMGLELSISKADQVVCYREIRELKARVDEPDYCNIYLDLEAAPGGYCWIFPEGGTKVNVGLGVATVEGHPNPKSQLYRHIFSMPMFKDSSIVHGGGGIVPTRKPLDSLVGNGVVLVGDAGCQDNPIHGGGIGPSMMGGRIAGEIISEALDQGNPSRESLWPINVRYMKEYGAKQAGLDVFRVFLQQLANADLDYGMRYKIIKEDDVLKASMGEDIRLNVTEATRRIFAGLSRMSFLRGLYNMAKTAKKIKALYGQYPNSPDGLLDWKLQIENLRMRA